MSDQNRSTEEQELEELGHEARRPSLDTADVEVKLFDAVRAQSEHPVQPVRLTSQDTFNFRCHKGISCWNRCCHGADITLTPYCILRLSRRLGLEAADFLRQYTVPDTFQKTDLPVAKLKMAGEDGKGACPFVTDEGCSVYDDRPATCRYYPLGVVSMKMKDAETKDSFNFLVREPHCRGHDEAREVSVAAFRDEQGVEPYERANQGWVDILMKMASWSSLGGFGGKAPTPQTRQMFFLATTDVEGFRRFVLQSSFLEKYEVDPEAVEQIKADDEALLQLAYDWLKNVLFNEPTISLKEDVLKGAIAKAREDLGAA